MSTSPFLPPHPSARPRTALGSLLFAFLVTASFAKAELPLLRTPSAPPAFPDSVHLENGCYVSTLVYLAKFAAAFPTERAVSLTVHPHNFPEPHTIVLLTWQGHGWGRDEYAGVFAVHAPVGDAAVNASVQKKAEVALARRSTELVTSGQISGVPPTRPELSVAHRTLEVAADRTLLPGASEQFWIRSGDQEFPVLFFRPAPNKIAVYDPQHGTATAETTIQDSARIVALVAAQLGYRSDSIRREAVTPAVLIASSAMPRNANNR